MIVFVGTRSPCARAQLEDRDIKEMVSPDGLMFELDCEQARTTQQSHLPSTSLNPLPSHPPTDGGRHVHAAVQKVLLASPQLAGQHAAFAKALADLLPDHSVLVREVHPLRPRPANSPGSWALTRLHHTYVLVRMPNDNTASACQNSPAAKFGSNSAAGAAGPTADLELVVEPDLAGQLALPAAGEEYAALLRQAIPNGPVVATCTALGQLLRQVAACMARMYSVLGLSLAPWRTPAALLGKWLGAEAVDTVISTPRSSILHPTAAKDIQQRLSWGSGGTCSDDSEADDECLPGVSWLGDVLEGSSPDTVLPTAAQRVQLKGFSSAQDAKVKVVVHGFDVAPSKAAVSDDLLAQHDQLAMVRDQVNPGCKATHKAILGATSMQPLRSRNCPRRAVLPVTFNHSAVVVVHGFWQ